MPSFCAQLRLFLMFLLVSCASAPDSPPAQEEEFYDSRSERFRR